MEKSVSDLIQPGLWPEDVDDVTEEGDEDAFVRLCVRMRGKAYGRVSQDAKH